MSSIFNGASDFSQNLGAWYITGDLSVSPALEAGAEVTTFTAQNSVLSGHNPGYMLGGADSSAFTLTDGVLSINAAPAAIGALYDIRISITGSGTVLVGTDNHRDLTFAVNNKPMITSNNGDSQYEITLPENTKAVTTITATDMDANTLTYTLSNNDAALFEINNAGELSFKDEYIPDYENPRDSQGNIDQNADQEYSVLVSVSDGVSTRTQEIIVTIENVTVVAPDISVSPGFQNANVGVAITPFVITNNGGTATYSISPGLPAGLSIDTATGTISGTPTAISGSNAYIITATNAAGSDTATIFGLSVQQGIIAPNISVSPSMLTFTVGIPVTTNPITITNSGGPPDAGFLIFASDGQTLSADTGLSYNHLTGVISGTPTRAVNARIYRIQADNAGGTSRTTITVTVNAAVVAPDIPAFPSPSFLNANVGIAISPVTITNSGGAATYSISPDLPAGLSIDTATGTISGTPTETASSGINYTITATNDAGSDNAGFTLSVLAHTAPNISVSPRMLTFTVGIPVTTNPITITNSGGASNMGFEITGANGKTLTGNTGLSYNFVQKVISGTPTMSASAEIYTIRASNSGGSSETTITITVNAAVVAPDLPDISVSPGFQNATVGVAITPFVITNNGGTATYSIAPNLPAGLVIDLNTGTVSGTPTEEFTSINYHITATNITGSDVVTFTLSVQPSGIIAPNISVSPSSLTFTVGIPVTTNPITITNSGGPADAGFVISNTSNSQSLEDDTGLSYNYLTGVISGTPTRAVNARIYRIQADNAGGTSRTTITVTVNAAVVAPSISINPATVTVTAGTAIADIIITSSGGDAVSYSIDPDIANGLSFDETSGTISGTPSEEANLITYTITAENSVGSDTATVAITVNEAPTTSVAVPIISISRATLVATVGTAIQQITIVSSGGMVSNYSINPAIANGLSFDATNGTISGIPTAVAPSRTYIITATNSGGMAMATVAITVNDVAPSISMPPRATQNVTVGKSH